MMKRGSTSVETDAGGSAVAASVRIELAGGAQLARHDGSTIPLEPQDAALLAIVALEGPVRRERVYTLLWPECSRQTAQGNLRQRLFRLRKKTGVELVVPGDRLALAAGVEHDLDAGATAHGGLLGDLRFDAKDELTEWLDAAREKRHREGSERLAAEASRLEAEGRLAEAIDLAKRLTEREPALEHAHRRLMRLHYRRGDSAAALEAYQRCRVSLERTVGAAPSAETEVLAALVRRSEALPQASPAPPPVVLLRPPRLIGRAAAWQAWEQGWQQGHLIVVRGEPGIGKSRLLGDFAAAHGAGEPLRAHPGDARMPYTTWSRWLRDWHGRFGASKQGWAEAELARLVPGIGTEPDTPFAPLRFHQACVAALADWFAAGLEQVVIDDLHHADEASLETLLAWCSGQPRQRIAMAVRSTEMPASLVGWLEGQRGSAAVAELALEALEPEDVDQLVESLALPGAPASGRTTELMRITGGNPFFLLEVLRADGDRGGADDQAKGGTPFRATPPLRHLLSQRLTRLAPEALRLVRIAGLAGADFDVQLAAATLGVHPLDLADAWAALEEAQVFRDGGFVHDLMLESAAASVPAAIAKTLHGAIAKALDPSRVAAARIAHHAFEAGHWAVAARNLENAAGVAFAAVRHREVVELYDRARACHERLADPRAAFRVECRSIDSAVHVEDEAALERRTSTLSARAEGDAEVLAASIARMKHLGSTQRIAEMIAPGEHAVRLARSLGDADAELMAAGLLAVALISAGRHEQALALMRVPAARFRESLESLTSCEFAMAYAQALVYVGRMVEAEQWSQRAISSCERLGRIDDLAVQWANSALIRTQLGRIDEAVAAARHAVSLHAQHGEASGATALYAWVALAHGVKRTAGWTEAEALLERALAAARNQVPAVVPVFENHLATFYLELGQYARARQTLVTPAKQPATVLRRALIATRLDAQAGHADLGRLRATMAEHRYGDGGRPFDRFACQLGTALAADAAFAMPLCRAVRSEAESLGLPAVALAALARLASAAHEAGAHEEALQYGRVGLAESASVVPHDMDAPELAWHLHQGLVERAPAEAAELARRTVAQCESQLSHLAEHYRDAYWHRSPFLPRLRALVARTGR